MVIGFESNRQIDIPSRAGTADRAERAPLSGIPLWFGPESMFGVLHLPDGGQARGGVAICSSLGAEDVLAHAALRRLAEGLQVKGFAVLHFDWIGSGQSAGDLREAWYPDGLRQGVRFALDFLDRMGTRFRIGIGFGLGGTVIASAGAQLGLDAAVLWSPYPSGRAFLRAQRALLSLTGTLSHKSEAPGTSLDVPLDLPGWRLPAEAARDLTRLRVDHPDRLVAPRLLTLHDPKPSSTFRQFLENVGGEGVPTTETQAMLFRNVLPGSAIATITAWCDHISPHVKQPVTIPEHLVNRPLLGIGGRPEGTERIVTVGDVGLVGVLCEPEHATARGAEGAPLLFLNTSVEPGIGPGRMWVQLSRRAASKGRRALRLDVSGLGDSPARPGQKVNLTYQSEAIDDVVVAARWLSPVDPGRVVLVGSCSGAYNCMEAALEIRPKGVVLINPVLDPQIDTSIAHVADRPLLSPRRSWLSHLEHQPIAQRLREVAPSAAWRLMELTRVQPSPARGLRPVASSVGSILLLCGPVDGRRFRHRSRWVIDKLVRSGKLDFRVVEGLDHALHTCDAQEEVRDLLIETLALELVEDAREPTTR